MHITTYSNDVTTKQLSRNVFCYERLSRSRRLGNPRKMQSLTNIFHSQCSRRTVTKRRGNKIRMFELGNYKRIIVICSFFFQGYGVISQLVAGTLCAQDQNKDLS